MKKIIYYISIVGLLLAFNACEDFLDINPESEVVNDDMFDNSIGAEDALNGVYSVLSGSNLFGERLLWEIPELLSQNIKPANTGVLGKQIAEYDYEANELKGAILNVWIDMYEVISYLNNAIINIERNHDKLLPYADSYLGEAYGLRAFLHLELLKYYAPHVETYGSEQGIPYVTTYSFEHPEFKTVSECYAAVVADLKKAKELLVSDQEQYFQNAPRVRGKGIYDGFMTSRETHFNYYASTALLARTYWLMGDYDNAKVEADEVINSGKFPLVTSDEIQDLVAGTLSKKETIFGLYSTSFVDETNASFYTSLYNNRLSPYVNTNWKTYLQSRDDVYGAYLGENANVDSRNEGWYRSLSSPKTKHFLKLTDVEFIENGIGNGGIYTPENRGLIEGFSLIRIPEMYYIAAEAVIRQGGDALSYINPVLNSRGLTNLEQRIPAIVPDIDFLTNERHKEYFGEGMRWLEMKKYNLPILSNVENLEYAGGNDFYVFPIPLEELIYR